MGSNLQKFKLGNRCKVQSSKRIFAKEYVQNGIPFFRSKDVIDKSLGNFTNYNLFISKVRYEELKRTHGSPQKGDVLINSVGNRSGHPYVVQDEGDFYFKDGNILWLNNFVDINSEFLAYWFKSDIGQQTLSAIMIGSAQKALTITALQNLWVSFPPIRQQNNIARILKSIDDKIKLNHERNNTSEQISQAIFKSWFVDFEPVKAKDHIRKLGGNPDQIERAAQAVITGVVNLDDILKGSNLEDTDGMIRSKLDKRLESKTDMQRKELTGTARLFPDKLVNSELGAIPEGWDTNKLSEEYNITMGQSPPGHTYNEKQIGMAFFQGRRDFGWRYPKNRVYCEEPKRTAKAGDTLLSVRAPVGDINLAAVSCCIGRGLAALRHKSGCEIYTYYSMMELRHRLEFCYSDGTVFNSINQKDLKSIRILKPPSSIISKFGKALKASEVQIQNFENQSDVLCELKEALLPKLISGEIQVTV